MVDELDGNVATGDGEGLIRQWERMLSTLKSVLVGSAGLVAFGCVGNRAMLRKYPAYWWRCGT